LGYNDDRGRIVSALVQRIIAALLLVALAGTGAGWWLAARDRDQVRIDLDTERAISNVLRTDIAKQNTAVDALAKAKAAADARGALAQQLATANGKRFDGALAKIAAARATTCAEAMPAVDALLKGIL
jgi:hypothetical protein